MAKPSYAFFSSCPTCDFFTDDLFVYVSIKGKEDPYFICALELELITSVHSPPSSLLPTWSWH